jgi:hypothetical protein
MTLWRYPETGGVFPAPPPLKRDMPAGVWRLCEAF